MAKDKLGFEQFISAVDTDSQSFIQNLHNYLIINSCKATFEEKKSGFLASYKHGKPPRAVANFLFRKKGMLVRIYGENISSYPDFLNTLPDEMIQAIEDASVCKRLVHNTCSPNCAGYDFTIGDKHFQRCRYSCFEFPVNNTNNLYIKLFVENETKERSPA